MKKSFIKVFVVFIFFLVLCFSGCLFSKQKREEINHVNLFIYEYTFDLLDPESINNKYLPESFITELNRFVIKDGIFFTQFQSLYPNLKNSFENYDFYDCHLDDGAWVDDVFIQIEEERIAAELLEMENKLNEIENLQTSAETTEENKSKINELISKEVMNYDRSLSFMEFDKEIFIPQKDGENIILIHANEGNVTRFFYDKIFRNYKKEQWKIDNNGKEDLIQTENTIFLENQYIPISKNIITKDYKIDKKYNQFGYEESEEKYAILDNKYYLQSKLNFKYNNDNKIIESLLTEYKYKDDKYSELLYSFDKKYIYTYNKDDISPDFDYYEEGILKVQNKYTKEGEYTSRIYFDNGYNVTTFYQNNKPIKEVFSIKDKVERVKYYE